MALAMSETHKDLQAETGELFRVCSLVGIDGCAPMV